jgi:hypothetical protein
MALRRKCGTGKTGRRFLLSPVAHHRHDGRAVWIDPVVLRAITISWNNIGIPVRSWPYNRDDQPLPRFTNDFGLPCMGCGTERPQVAQHQRRSESERGHYPHTSASLPQSQINERRSCSFQLRWAKLKPVACRAGWSRPVRRSFHSEGGRRNPPFCRFMTADHDPPYALHIEQRTYGVSIGTGSLELSVILFSPETFTSNATSETVTPSEHDAITCTFDPSSRNDLTVHF